MRGLLAFGIILLIIGFCVYMAWLLNDGPKWLQRRTEEHRRLEWDEAVMNARWVPYEEQAHGVTQVGIQLTARTQWRSEVLIADPPIESFDTDSPDWNLLFRVAMSEAKARCEAKNEVLDANESDV